MKGPYASTMFDDDLYKPARALGLANVKKKRAHILNPPTHPTLATFVVSAGTNSNNVFAVCCRSSRFVVAFWYLKSHVELIGVEARPVGTRRITKIGWHFHDDE